MMRHGVLIRTDGTCHGWTWADETAPFPGEYPVAPGDRLYDLSRHSNDDAQSMIRLCLNTSTEMRDTVLSAYPCTIIPETPPPPPGHETVCQPGYRRIAYRPSLEWHGQEIAARLTANARIAQGEQANTAIDDAFTHLDDEDRARRSAMHNGGPFPLTPLVTLQDGVRHFPYHEPVADI